MQVLCTMGMNMLVFISFGRNFEMLANRAHLAS